MAKSLKRPLKVVFDLSPFEKARLDAIADRLELTKQQALRQLLKEAAERYGIEIGTLRDKAVAEDVRAVVG
jgi:hypothetical protein